jgi:class 3 adenylate cyclase/tetratricopeptide (TPR) repeat protein
MRGLRKDFRIMPFSDVHEVEEALRSSRLSVRALHEIWEQRLPVPEPAPRKPAKGGDGRLLGWIQEDLRLASHFSRQSFEAEDFQLVCDAAREILRYWDQEGKASSREFVGIRTHFASALTRLGYLQEARHELAACLRSSPGTGRKAEIFRLLGDVEREEAHRASDRSMAVQAVEAALNFYRQAHELEPDSLEAGAWMAAGTIYVAGEHSSRRDEGLDFARQLLDLAAAREHTEGTRFATLRARAEALLLLGKEDEATAAYDALRSVEDGSISALAEARYRTCFIADALSKPRDFFKRAFPPLQLIVFTGHLPDLPGQPQRFPANLVDPVRERLRNKLAELQAHIGIASAAAGADLLFLEQLGDRAASLFHVVLPWSEDEFRRTSLRPYEPNSAESVWEPLFDQAVERAATIRELGEFYAPSDSIGWQYMSEVTAGLALHTARMLRLDLQPLALWDRQRGRGAGGTEDFVKFCRDQLGAEPMIVDLPRPGSERALEGGQGVSRRVERSALHQEVKSMLFADIVGYSKLTEVAIPEFVTCFLERVSQLAANSQHAPQSVNTWGDAVYAVFDFAVDAGNFALELARMIHDNDAEWVQRGLYWEEPASGGKPAVKHPLNIRIGLHTGPVFLHYDPVVRRLGYTGAHVSRAARIEPVTKPGEVFASEEFTAFAELDAARRRYRGEPEVATFVCEYAGSMALAKGYPGRYRIYRLVPGRRLDIEELAKAIHELYCEEARKRNETPETNGMLRTWADLSENMRDANREQAADIPNKLQMMGYELTHRGGVKPAEMLLTAEAVEVVAKYEHLRWMAERQRQGWTYAPVRDNERKHQPLLVDWEQLSETEKNKDRDTARNLPALIGRAGFRVRRIGEIR